jgi:hypothetical protein
LGNTGIEIRLKQMKAGGPEYQIKGDNLSFSSFFYEIINPIKLKKPYLSDDDK